MSECEGLKRAKAIEAYEAIESLDPHGELIRAILAEVSLLTEAYRYVRRHDIPHISELSGLLDVLWQEVEMQGASGKPDDAPVPTPLFRIGHRTNAPEAPPA